MARSTLFVRAAAALGAAAIALAGLLGLVAEPAGAAPSTAAQQQQPARTLLVLAVAPQNAPATVAVLTCDPPGGTHPDAVAACRDLRTAGGDFTRLPGEPDAGACPDVWQPVTATAFGWWEGRVTWFSRLYGNPCELRVTTGPVFPGNMAGIDNPTTT